MTARRVSEIWIYPIKSLGGIRQKVAKVAAKGLQYDRRWMLIAESNVFLTQRNVPKMALFKLAFKGSSLLISFEGDTIEMPLSTDATQTKINATIWSDKVITYEVEGNFHAWFSRKLGFPCKLVFFPEESTRWVDSQYAINNDQVSLADGYPLLVIGQLSLDDLNQRLQQAVPMDRFRPNIVFTGGEPYEEDSWRQFIVGANRFIGVKPCSRCVLTTIDQTTGVAGKEPLTTLASYRKRDNKIYFGQNVSPIDHFEIKEGDEITIQ